MCRCWSLFTDTPTQRMIMSLIDNLINGLLTTDDLQGTISQSVFEIIIHILQRFSCFLIWKILTWIRSHFCTWHDSWDVVTCANLRSDLIIMIVSKSKSMFIRIHAKARKSLVRLVPDSSTSRPRGHRRADSGMWLRSTSRRPKRLCWNWCGFFLCSVRNKS